MYPPLSQEHVVYGRNIIRSNTLLLWSITKVSLEVAIFLILKIFAERNKTYFTVSLSYYDISFNLCHIYYTQMSKSFYSSSVWPNLDFSGMETATNLSSQRNWDLDNLCLSEYFIITHLTALVNVIKKPIMFLPCLLKSIRVIKFYVQSLQ